MWEKLFFYLIDWAKKQLNIKDEDPLEKLYHNFVRLYCNTQWPNIADNDPKTVYYTNPDDQFCKTLNNIVQTIFTDITTIREYGKFILVFGYTANDRSIILPVEPSIVDMGHHRFFITVDTPLQKGLMDKPHVYSYRWEVFHMLKSRLQDDQIEILLTNYMLRLL